MPPSCALLLRLGRSQLVHPQYQQQCCLSLLSWNLGRDQTNLNWSRKLLNSNRSCFLHTTSAAGFKVNDGDIPSSPLFSESVRMGPSTETTATNCDDEDSSPKMTFEESGLMTADVENLIDLDAIPGNEIATEHLVIDNTKGSTDLRRTLNYMASMEKSRLLKSGINIGLVGISFDSLRENIVSVMRDCGVSEQQALSLAICLRGSKPPSHLKETIDVLYRHSISLNKILSDQWDSLLAFLVVRPEQLEERIAVLKEAGLTGQEIERLDATSLLLPMQDHIIERLRSLAGYEGGDVDGLRGRSLSRLAPQQVTLQCSESDVKTFISVENVLIELGITATISARHFDAASNANTLRHNLISLATPPLCLSTSVLGALMTHRTTSAVLAQFGARFVNRHVNSLVELAELNFPEDPIAMLVQKMESFPGLLDVNINMEMRKALIARLIKEVRERTAATRTGKNSIESQQHSGDHQEADSDDSNVENCSSGNQGKSKKSKKSKKGAKSKVKEKKGAKGNGEDKKDAVVEVTAEEQREEDIRCASLLFANNTVLFALDDKTLITLWRILSRQPKTSLKKILNGYVFTQSVNYYISFLAKRRHVKKPRLRRQKSPMPALDPGIVKFFKDLPHLSGEPNDGDV